MIRTKDLVSYVKTLLGRLTHQEEEFLLEIIARLKELDRLKDRIRNHRLVRGKWRKCADYKPLKYASFGKENRGR